MISGFRSTSLGNAQSAKQGIRGHNARRTVQAVGGMTNLVRAVYGSTDRATGDHSNDPLCRITDRNNFTNNPTVVTTYAVSNVFRYADFGTTSLPAKVVPVSLRHTARDHNTRINFMVTRATVRGMSIVQYAQLQGITL